MGPDPSESTSETLHFPKLSGTNYNSWSDNMKAALQARYLWLFIKGDEVCPLKPPQMVPVDSEGNPFGRSTAEYKDWKQDHDDYLRWLRSDGAAMGLIRGAIDFSQCEHIANASTSKEMWDLLRSIHVTQRQGITVHYLYQEIYSKKWDERTPMSDHIGYFLRVRQQIIEAREKLDETQVIHAILLSLPHTNVWDVVRQNLLDKGKNLTMEVVTAELVAVHERLLRDKQAEEVSEKVKADQLALLSRQSGSSSGSGGKGGKKSKKGKGKRKAKPEDECFNCHQKGHWKGDCPSAPKNEKKPGGKSANLTVEEPQSSGIREVGQMVIAVSGGTLGLELLLDCGATSHMFTQRECFDAYTSSDKGFVTVGGRNRVPVVGQGTVKFRAKLPQGITTVILHNVLHVPHLGANLVSLGALQRNGATIQSDDGGLIIMLKGEPLFRAVLAGETGTLYFIQRAYDSEHSAFLARGETM